MPFDVSTVEGRSNERFRRAILTSLVSVLFYVINVMTVLISVPLTLNYLGAERYGLWMIISSLITILGFADMGMGNGLLNAIADANGRDDRNTAKACVSSIFYALVGMASLFGIIWIVLYPYVSWGEVLNVVTPKATVEAGPAISVLVWCALVGLPLGLVQKIYDGYQEGYINGLWRVGGSLLGLGSLLFAIHLQADLPWLVFSMAGTPVLIQFFSGIVLFNRRPWLRPRRRMFQRDVFIRVLRSGWLFFILQFAAVLGFQSDNLVIAHFLGASQVSQYAVPMKLFMFVPSLINFFLIPLWPAYGEAIVRKDISWVLATFKRSLFISFSVSLVLSIFLVVFGRAIIGLWVGPEIHPDLVFLVGLGLWVVLLGIAGPLSVFLNGANKIGFQSVSAIVMVICNIVLSIFLVQKIGVPGPVYGSLVSWFLFSLIPIAFYVPRLFSSWKTME